MNGAFAEMYYLHTFTAARQCGNIIWYSGSSSTFLKATRQALLPRERLKVWWRVSDGQWQKRVGPGEVWRGWVWCNADLDRLAFPRIKSFLLNLFTQVREGGKNTDLFAVGAGRAWNCRSSPLLPVVSEAEGSGEGTSISSGLSGAVRALSGDTESAEQPWDSGEGELIFFSCALWLRGRRLSSLETRLVLWEGICSMASKVCVAEMSLEEVAGAGSCRASEGHWDHWKVFF